MSTKTEREKYKQTAIGETFEWKGKTLKVEKETLGCLGCFFFPKKEVAYNCFGLPACSSRGRDDRTNVIFILIKETPKAAD